ncbi:MAG: hypothetical protein EU531_09150 [Promethearchaeota archaeon]|nr:MAG: hypothetical protein EU531_09150 [Candidatus Lokiarchaeota archaeon]
MKVKHSFILIILFFGILFSLGASLLLNQSINLSSKNPNLPLLSFTEDWVSPWDQYNEEFGRGITIDESTGELFTVGYNGTTTNQDIVLIKYNNLGQHLWNLTWDNGANEIGYDVSLDSQKNIYIAGGNGTTFPNLDGLLLKFNSTGNLVWKRSYHGGLYDNFWALHIDNNDNIFVVSQSIFASYDTVVLKYNSTGHLQWTSVIGGPTYQSCYDITLDDNGNIYLAGLNGSAPSYNYLVVKMDSSGNHLWNRTWGGSQSDQAYAVGVDSLYNVYITGFSTSFGSPNKDITLVKYDTNGNKLWNSTWDSTPSWQEEAWSIAFDSAGYVYVGGYQINGDIFILKYNSAGSLIWDKYWDRGSMYSNWCYDLIIDSNDNIYFTGFTLLTAFYDIITVKLTIDSPGGFTLWSDADTPDDDGEFTLNWSISSRVNNYSLFYSNISANIDIESELPWIQDITDNGVDVTFNNGTYYFLVVAYNDYGYAVSNYESVTVEIEPTGPPTDVPRIPGYTLFVISISMLVIILVIAFRTKKLIK